jgi:hypothetical protein
MKLLPADEEKLCEFHGCDNWVEWKVQNTAGDYLLVCDGHAVAAETLLQEYEPQPTRMQRFLASL